MRTLQCHAGPILVGIGVALRLPGPISAGGGVRGSESGCNINLKKVLQGNAAGKCASQPLRATSAAQPKGCSGSSVPRAGTTSHQRNAFPPRNRPQSGTNPPKKCISSPKPAPFRDKLPPERLFLPEVTQIRDKSCIGAGAAMHKKAGLRYLNADRPIYPT